MDKKKSAQKRPSLTTFANAKNSRYVSIKKEKELSYQKKLERKYRRSQSHGTKRRADVPEVYKEIFNNTVNDVSIIPQSFQKDETKPNADTKEKKNIDKATSTSSSQINENPSTSDNDNNNKMQSKTNAKKSAVSDPFRKERKRFEDSKNKEKEAKE
eukprot:Awhi_evm2s6148